VWRRDEVGLPSFWQLQAVGWIGFYLVVVLAVLPYGKSKELWNQAVGCAVMFLASCGLRYVCRSLVRKSPSWFSFELQVLVWSAGIGTLAAFVSELALLGALRLMWTDFMVNDLQVSIVLFLWCTLYFSVKQWQQSRRETERLLRAENEARDARLSALRYQLNPHFLFNSLNAVSTLVLKQDGEGATRMLSQIAGLLRATLASPPVSMISLSEELDFIQQYLAIEQTRLGKRLEVIYRIASETLEATVPSLLLQPLVENAVRHGVGRLREGGVVTIETSFHQDRLRLVVQNSGPRSAEGIRSLDTTSGIGLKNTKERLHTLYGADYALSFAWPEPGGCEVTIELPFQKIALPAEEMACAQ
jgi:two-component system, LytTR family, sensor kinase